MLQFFGEKDITEKLLNKVFYESKISLVRIAINFNSFEKGLYIAKFLKKNGYEVGLILCKLIKK